MSRMVVNVYKGNNIMVGPARKGTSMTAHDQPPLECGDYCRVRRSIKFEIVRTLLLYERLTRLVYGITIIIVIIHII